MPAATYSSFAGGMNAASQNPRLVAPDCCPLIVNGTVRKGFIEPRPSIRRRLISWLDSTAQQVFEHGVYQGSAFYASERGFFMLYAFDGHIVSYDIIKSEARCLTINKQAFSKDSPVVYFGMRHPYAIAQDGISPPVIIRGQTCSQGTNPYTSVPCGTMMVNGWGRLAVVSPDRTRIYFSNHEADPTAPNVLTFTEGTQYYLNAPYFIVPANLGRITAIDFAPSFFGGLNLGPLMVFCEFGTQAYDVSQPRSSWATTNIAVTPLPVIGACSHKAIARRGNDMVFSDQRGHIQTVKSAERRDQDERMEILDTAMWPIYRDEDAGLRSFRQCARFDDRTLTTILPQRRRRDDGRWNITHTALAVHLENPAPTQQKVVWDGIWTGLGFTAIDTATFSGQDHCLIVSTDPDGVNRIYELTTETTGHDVGAADSPIEFMARLNPTDFGAVFQPKTFTSAALRLGGKQGTVSVSGFWSHDRRTPQPWFSDSQNVPYATDTNGANAQPEPRMNLPAPPRNASKFLECQAWITVTGQARIEEIELSVGNEPNPQPTQFTTSAGRKRQIPADTLTPPNPYAYAIPA